MQIRWHIRRKLNVLLGLCGLVFIVISAPVISFISFAEYKQAAQSQQARLVEAVRQSAAIATFVSNQEIAKDVLEGLLRDEEILAVSIEGENAFRAAASNGPLSEQQSPNQYPLFSPVDEREEVGSIKVWSNVALIEEKAFNAILTDLGWLALLTILLIIASIFATNFMVATPLRNLANQLSISRPGQTQKIHVGQFHIRDEIGLVTGNINNFLEITRSAIEKERELREQIEKMNQHFSNIFSSSNVGIMVVDKDGRILHHNPVLFDRILNLNSSDRATVETEDVFSLCFDDANAIWKLINNAKEQGETLEIDMRIKTESDSKRWVHCIVTVNQEDEYEEVIECVLYDVTKRIKEAEKAKKLAEIDSLTGLSNRRGCERYIKQWLEHEKDQLQLIVMLLDLDNFKPVNDAYGHNSGDLVLETIATRLQSEVRSKMDLVGRVGGDEFIVFLKMDSVKHDAVARVAHKIIQRISEPIEIMGEKVVTIGVSIGIASAINYENLDDLINAADKAMYQVKAKGKNDFIFAD